jgi:hypothetical protein
MLDGLDQGLQGAITEAVKQAVATAVSEAVQATLLQIVTNPEIHTLIRVSLTSLIQQTMPPQPARESAVQEAESRRNALSRAWNWTVGKIKAAGQSVLRALRKVRDGVVGTIAGHIDVSCGGRSDRGRRRRRVRRVGYASAPWLAGVSTVSRQPWRRRARSWPSGLGIFQPRPCTSFRVVVVKR